MGEKFRVKVKTCSVHHGAFLTTVDVPLSVEDKRHCGCSRTFSFRGDEPYTPGTELELVLREPGFKSAWYDNVEFKNRVYGMFPGKFFFACQKHGDYPTDMPGGCPRCTHDQLVNSGSLIGRQKVEILQLENDLGECRSSYTAMKGSLEEANRSAERYSNIAENATAEVKVLRASLNAKDKVIEDLQRELSRAGVKNSEIRGALDELFDMLVAVGVEVDDSYHLIDRFEKKVEFCKKVIKSRGEQISDLEKQLAEATKPKLDDLDIQIDGKKYFIAEIPF